MTTKTTPMPAHEILRTLAVRALSLEPAPRGAAISATLERMAAAITPRSRFCDYVSIVPADLAAGLRRLAGTWHPRPDCDSVPASDDPAVIARRATLAQLASILECEHDRLCATYLGSMANVWEAIVGLPDDFGIRHSRLVDNVAPRREATLATLTRELGEMRALLTADEDQIVWYPEF